MRTRNITVILIALIALIAFILSGCTTSNESYEYRDFVDKYGSDTRTFCDGDFLMRETFMHKKATAPQQYLINSQECKY